MFMHAVLVVTILRLAESFLVHQHSLKRTESTPSKRLGCPDLIQEQGRYYYDSPTGESMCSVLIAGPPDKLVRITFDFFHVDCDQGSFLMLTDGWEIEDQTFPSYTDLDKREEERHLALCNPDYSPLTSYEFSQNAAMISWQIQPQQQTGFSIFVRFVDNPYPCNVISLRPSGTVTLRNFGRRVNCSFSIMHPSVIDLLSADIGLQSAFNIPQDTIPTAFFAIKCKQNAMSDYAELLDADGLDPTYMWRTVDFCGQYSSSIVNRLSFPLGCKNTVIRLVSSGKYDNSLTFSYRPLSSTQQKRTSNRQC